MAISASSVLPTNSLETFRIEFNNLVSDVGGIDVNNNNFLTSIVFEGSTTDGYETTLTLTDPTADRTITLPNVTGNVTVSGNPVSADGEALGTTSLEWSDLYLADGSVIYFGADQDVTLTHVADTGLLLNSTMQLQFNDASQNINAPSATVLDINATDEIELNATLVDVNANLDVSGTYTGGGLMTTGGNIVIPNAGNIGSASDTNAISISSGGVVAVTATTANTSASDGALTVAGGAGVAADLSVGDDLRLISDAAVLNFGADSDVNLTHVADTGLLLNSTRQLQFNDASQYISGASATKMDIRATDEIELTSTLVDVVGALTVSGTTTLNGALVLGDAAADTLTVNATLQGASPLTFEGGTADGYETTFAITDPTADRTITFPNLTGTVSLITATETLTNKTLTSPVLNTATVGTSIVPTSADGATLGTASVEWSDIYLADGAVINFGDDQDVTLTHVADAGLLLNSSMYLTFRDSALKIYSSADGQLDIDADTEVEITATTVDLNGNLDVSGTFTVAGTTTLNGNLVLGDAAADTLTVGATLQGASPLTFEGGTADGYETTFAITDPTADRTITFPNLTGTVSLITASETLTNKTLTAAVAATSFDMNGTELFLDADADTSITADTDDQIDFKISGADDFRMTANTFTVLSGSTLTIASGATIDGSSATLTGFASAADVTALAIALG